jgi:hypothetical protein
VTSGLLLLLPQVMTKLSFMKPPAAVDLRRENIEYVSVMSLVPPRLMMRQSALHQQW